MTYLVNFRNWHNNWSEAIITEEYDNLHDARFRAETESSFSVTSLGNNCYVNNGSQTWIEDENGNIIFEGMSKFINECETEIE
jgi:hypothetical protein